MPKLARYRRRATPALLACLAARVGREGLRQRPVPRTCLEYMRVAVVVTELALRSYE